MITFQKITSAYDIFNPKPAKNWHFEQPGSGKEEVKYILYNIEYLFWRKVNLAALWESKLFLTVFHFLFRTNLAEPRLVENDTELESDISWEGHDDEQDEVEDVSSNFAKKRVKKSGRNATWHESTFNVVVDIIVSSKYVKNE